MPADRDGCTKKENIMFYTVILSLVRVFMFFVFRIRISGKENIPKDGGCILAVNHRSNWDVIIAGLSCGRHLRFMAKYELFENKFFGWLIKNLGAFPVHRGAGDIGAIKGALSILKQNEMMLMFPEGRRVKDENKAVHAKTGVAMLAHRARVPVIPAYISGEYKWMHKITITFGEPVMFDMLYGQKLDGEKLQELSDQVLRTMRSYKVEK